MFINLILSLANSFLLEMVITKDPSYLSLQYFMHSVTVACHLTLCSNNMGTHNERIIDSEFLSASTILLYMYQPKNVYLIFGRAKRAPHWGVQSRFRVIYMLSVCRMSYVCRMSN